MDPERFDPSFWSSSASNSRIGKSTFLENWSSNNPKVSPVIQKFPGKVSHLDDLRAETVETFRFVSSLSSL
jgi:hypothetical protein